MLAPSDHCLRPVRSLLSFFRFDTHSPSPRHAPRSSSVNDSTGNPSTPSYEVDRPTSAAPQIQITEPAPAHASPQPPGSIFATLPTFAGFPTIKPPSTFSSDHCFPSHRPQEDVTITDITFLPEVRSFDTSVTDNVKPNLYLSQSSTSRRRHPLRPSTPQYEDGHHSTLHLSTNPYPTPTVDEHHLVDPPSRPLLNHVHHLTPPHRNVGRVPQPGTPLEPPPSNQGPSCSQIRGQGIFPQAHDFVIKNSVFVDNSVFGDNSSDNCEYHSTCLMHTY
jgi:hypothetical protein